MKTAFLVLAFSCLTLPASAQRAVFIAYSGDESPRLVDEIKAAFFALDGVELVAELQDAELIAVVKHRHTGQMHAVSIVALFAGPGQLLYLGDELIIDDSDKSAARRMAVFFKDQVLAE